MKKRLLFCVICALTVLSSIPVSAAYSGGMLSPALQVISQNTVMIKSGLITGKISFKEEDFEKAVGGKIDSITITSTPSPSDGILTYNGSAVSVNQTISSSGLSELRFVPSGSSETGSFRFKTSSEYSIECVLRYTDTINLAPSAGISQDSVSVWTQCDIKTFSSLSGNDPDGDEIVFEIVDFPEKGILDLTNASTGEYTYTPCDGCRGKDSFTYVVRDEWGNYSEPASVVITIDKAACDLVFADMDGHWAHNAALVMASENAMEMEYVDGNVFFRPDEMITREDFIVTVMKVLGSGEIDPAVTVFADDDEISDEASGYIARAYSLGIVKGTEKNGLKYFNPTDTITRAEAAVILNSIIGAKEPDTLQAFADSDTVPSFAKSALYALNDEGIFKGTGSGNISPNQNLSRAQAAQILLTVKKLYS